MYPPDEKGRYHYLARFGYCGKAFRGVIRQPNQYTVTDALLDCFRRLGTKRVGGLQFASRTDAEVHADENFASFYLREPLCSYFEPDHPLPTGLTYIQLHEIPKTVHARNLALSKHYEYLIKDNQENDVWASDNYWPIAVALDPYSLQQASKLISGHHNFRAFSAIRAPEINTHRKITVTTKSITLSDGTQEFTIAVSGESFLRKQVRIIVGSLAEIASGLMPIHHLKHVLDSEDRALAGPTAPARGLHLRRIFLQPGLHDTMHLVGHLGKCPELPSSSFQANQDKEEIVPPTSSLRP
ncbi:MAG: tRNA pseudouridine synthase A [Myxococcota bacterium]|nr:tRNA pseudouridine synthase A [Myxococcota bacterium]